MKAIAGILLTMLSPGVAEGKESCLTYVQARKQWPDGYLKYRPENGGKCWYLPKAALKTVAKRVEPDPKPKRPVIPPAPDPLPPPSQEILDTMCGGPCPRFDLHYGPDAGLYRALCVGVCPDFRRMELKSPWDIFRR